MSAGPGVHPEVHPDRILADLADLWTSMENHPAGSAEEPEPSEDSGVVRACAMTLIAIADEEDDPQAIAETLATLMHSHPSRAIVVRVSEAVGASEAPGTLDARVFAQCWKPHGQRLQICCEQVELTVALNRLDDVPSIVAPITVPDLPRVVWFRSRRIGSAPDLSALIALGDKIVVDSAPPGAPTFADLRTLMAAGCIIGDLAWTRLTRLRELLAQLIGGRDPESVTGIELAYRGSQPDASTKYLQAWLRVAFSHAAVDLRKSAAGEPGELTAIRIAPDLNISLEKGCAAYEIGSRRQHANVATSPEHGLLAEELNIMEHDPVFERTLERMTPWAPRR